MYTTTHTLQKLFARRSFALGLIGVGFSHWRRGMSFGLIALALLAASLLGWGVQAGRVGFSSAHPQPLTNAAHAHAVVAAPFVNRTVTNTLDAGPGSLRQAILDATPVDTVVFDPCVQGTITLTAVNCSSTRI